MVWSVADDARSSDWGGHQPSFEVIASACIQLDIPSLSYRAGHSLWYCDAQEPGKFRWYEMAFRRNAMLTGNSSEYLSPLPPGRNAGTALQPIGTAWVLARPFVPIDQDKAKEFIERWATAFADAADGHPPHEYIREQDIWRSYRH